MRSSERLMTGALAMTESTLLTGTFLAVGTPLYVALGILAADGVRDRRRAMLLRRISAGPKRS
jgi:hypothetical protein